MTYKCVIIDDEELARRLIKNHLNQLSDFELVASCSSAIEASKVLQENNIDLLFLDIEMPVLKGVDFYKNLIHKPKVVFTTAYRDYAIDGFELNAVDYILKPITFQRFFNAIEKFKALYQNTEPKVIEETSKKMNSDFVYIRKDRKQVKVKFEDILYIESLKDYIKIHVSGQQLITKTSISSFIEKLDQRFIRIHRSYIINTNKITAYTKNDIEIGKFEIPIGENYRKEIDAFLQ